MTEHNWQIFNLGKIVAPYELDGLRAVLMRQFHGIHDGDPVTQELLKEALSEHQARKFHKYLRAMTFLRERHAGRNTPGYELTEDGARWFAEAAWRKRDTDSGPRVTVTRDGTPTLAVG